MNKQLQLSRTFRVLLLYISNPIFSVFAVYVLCMLCTLYLIGKVLISDKYCKGIVSSFAYRCDRPDDSFNTVAETCSWFIK
jgi:hypothetical protein